MLKSSIYFSEKQKTQNKLSLEAKMESFATFNFDILAIIVLIAGLLFGSYYGFGRQLKKTINSNITICYSPFLFKLYSRTPFKDYLYK